MVKNLSTEDRIMEAARKVFMKKGLNGARMQEIADEAGINKALLHYYFRSKDQLFGAIFQSAFKNMIPFVIDIFKSGTPLEVKIHRLAEKYFEMLENNRYLALFVLSEIQQNPDQVVKYLNITDIVDFRYLAVQIETEFGITKVDLPTLRHLFINFLSNMIFPFVARPVIQFNLKLSDEDFHQFLTERKKLIPQIFIRSLKSIHEYEKHD